MFPSALSEGLFSLLPDGTEKLVIGLTCIYDGNDLTDISFGEYKTEIHRTYSYEEAATSEELCGILGGVAATIARRIVGPEPALDVAAISQDSHTWIEQLMIFYNLEAAALLAAASRGIFREHAATSAEKLDAVRLLPADLQWVAANPAAYTFSAESTHSAAGARPYLHITSPIRRYVDLYNQRALKSVLNAHFNPPSKNTYIIRHLNDRQKIMKKYQRTMVFITNLLGASGCGNSSSKEVDATVVSIDSDKARLWIHNWATLVNVREYDGLAVADKVRLRFYYNPNRPNWKERIIFERQ
jgi:exoribonuclease R